MFAAGLAVALLDTVIPLFIGRVVSLMEMPDRPAALSSALPMLLGMAALVLVVRPLAIFTDVGSRRDEPDPLAEPLARRPPELQNGSASRSRASS
jgi:ATP-binding cassette, subfamily B, multidrug efflux pump